jgi:hypothetical protein
MVQLVTERDLRESLEAGLQKTLPAGWRAAFSPASASDDPQIDGVLELVAPTGETSQAGVIVKARLEPAQISRELPWLTTNPTSIVVAPRISARARGLLNDAGVSWYVPGGDYRIAIGGLFIERLVGQSKRRSAGAPDTRFVADVFAGGALRVVRWLLVEPGRSWSVGDMAERSGLTLGFASRTFKTLARDAYVERVRGATRLTDRDALLNAWAAAPSPPQSAFERVATVDSPEALLRMIRAFTTPSPYAVTAEAAADRLAPFARFSRVEMYVQDVAGWDRALGLTTVPRGGNVVLIKPADAGVFDGSFERDGVPLTSRPQLYVDLVRRGGAAAEAAAFMRERGALWPQ